MPYSDLPEPKYRVGQTVWRADTTSTEAQHDCPDCLGSKTWRVTTPAGGDYEVTCQRCAGGYTYSRQDEVVSLRYCEYVAAPRSMTIKSLEVRSWSDGPSIYYDGIGEGGLYDTEEAARQVSEQQAAKRNAENATKPDALAAKNISKLKIDHALYDQFANGLWNAWYAYRSLVEKLDSYLEDKETLSKADTGYLKGDIRWEVEYRAKEARPLDALVEAVRDALSGKPDGLGAAYAALPETLRRAPALAQTEAA